MAVAVANPVWSAEPLDLFEASVPVASQSSSERAEAARAGLRKVLTRMSGSPAAADAEGMQEAYIQAQNYIEQFHYEPYDPAGDVQPVSGANELLVMTFAQSVIERLLRDAGQPYWPPNRPSVLIWLVEDSASEGKLLVNNSEAPVVQGLLISGRQRGLEIRLPLLDLEDQLALPSNKLWQLNETAVLAASERYNADTVLVGRYSETSRGEWLSTWEFFHRGVAREYDFRADDGVSLGMAALAPLADYLATLYAVSPQDYENPGLVVNLSGISNFGDYWQALNYLGNLAVVSDVALQAVRGDALLLNVEAEGDPETLRNVLALDGKLQPAYTTPVDVNTPPWLRVEEGTPARPLQYVWRD